MTITVEFPENIAHALATNGDPSRAALEAMALEGYRRKLLGESQLRRILGFYTRMEVHAFLKEHRVVLNYGVEDLEHDIRESDRIIALRAAEASTEQHVR